MPPSTLVTSAMPAAKPSGSGVEAVEIVGAAAKKDEVAIVVGSRKNSITKAVR